MFLGSKKITLLKRSAGSDYSAKFCIGITHMTYSETFEYDHEYQVIEKIIRGFFFSGIRGCGSG